MFVGLVVSFVDCCLFVLFSLVYLFTFSYVGILTLCMFILTRFVDVVVIWVSLQVGLLVGLRLCSCFIKHILRVVLLAFWSGNLGFGY